MRLARAVLALSSILAVALAQEQNSSYCDVVNGGLAEFPWELMNFDLPQENASIPFMGTVGIVVTNLQIQGPQSVNCDMSLSLGKSYVNIQNFQIKVPNADWDWFKAKDSNPSHHKGTLTAEGAANAFIEVDLGTLAINQVTVKFTNFQLHIDADKSGWIYRMAQGYAIKHVQSGLQNAVNKYISATLGPCVANPSNCAARK
jgi:hypothetical protein